jgi:hypothetical protein
MEPMPMKSRNRQLIEMIDQLSKRAQQIALHNLDQLDDDAELYKESLPDQCLFCFLIAKEEASKTTP